MTTTPRPDADPFGLSQGTEAWPDHPTPDAASQSAIDDRLRPVSDDHVHEPPAAVPELIARVEAAEAELAEARALHRVAIAQAKGPAKWEIETLNSFGDWVPFSPSNADEADPSTWTRLGWSARYIARFSRAEEGSRMP